MKPNFNCGVLFGENLIGCEMGKTKVVMNKPVYLGQPILDLSKIVMHEFHYDYIKPKYGNNLTLGNMDTDSLWCITLKLKTSIKTLCMMWRQDSMRVVIAKQDHYP